MPNKSEPPQKPSDGTVASADQTSERPQIRVRGQYVKDLSFENPNAGKQFGNDNAPKIDISVSVNGRGQSDNNHEIELHISAKATVGGELKFLVELVYAGVFTITGIPADKLEPIVLIECPRILFPFARRIVADCCRDGGYPALMLEPIDFAQMYMQRKSEAREGQTRPEKTN